MTGLTAMAYRAHRSGAPTDAERAYAADQIRRRGLRPIIDAVNAQIGRALGPTPERRAGER